MAREYGVLHKKYRSRLRRCAISGLRFYQDEMVRVAEGRYVHPKYLDSGEGRKRGAGVTGSSSSSRSPGIPDDTYTEVTTRALILARPYGTPLAIRYGGEAVSLYRGADY